MVLHQLAWSLPATAEQSRHSYGIVLVAAPGIIACTGLLPFAECWHVK